MYKEGIIFGRFQVLHKGHLFLVEESLKRVEKLHLFIYSTEEDLVPFSIRLQWLKLAFHALPVDIHPHFYPLPTSPHDDDFFWEAWGEAFKAHFPTMPEVFINSEEYGKAFADGLGVKHLKIDQERRNFPVSSKQILDTPLRHWRYLHECVRPFFVKKIVLIGSESTGKSDLAKALSARLSCPVAWEYSREYFSAKASKSTLEDISLVAAGQLFNEEKAARESENGLLICDTDLISMQVWSELYFQRVPEWLLQLIPLKHYDFWLLMDIDVPWEDDPLRDFPHRREEHFGRLKELLEHHEKPYAVVTGQGEKRLENALRALRENGY